MVPYPPYYPDQPFGASQLPFTVLEDGLHIPVSLLLPRRCNSTVPSRQPSNYYPEGICTALLSPRTSGRGHIALLFLYFLGTYSWGHPALTISSPRGQTDPVETVPLKVRFALPPPSPRGALPSPALRWRPRAARPGAGA